MYELTEEQQIFMKSQGKNILCACPGSGKTYLVAIKVISYLEQSKLKHQGLAVLSFTNVASNEIMGQVEQLTGVSAKIRYPHFIGTVDSFINSYIVLQYGYLYNENSLRPQIALHDLWKFPFKYWRTECHQKRCTESIEDFYYGVDDTLYKNHKAVMCKPNKGQKIPPCAQYKKIFEKKGIIFQSEVSSFAYRILKENPNIAKAIASRFPVILIDEAQDTSEEQMAVFDLLFSAGVNSAFLVGDPDQSIYEWRNATPKCFLDKMDDESWKTLFLTANFRNSQNICNASMHFSQSLEGILPNNAKGCSADEIQKPILLLYAPEIEQSKIYEFFIEKCLEMNISIVPEMVAIVTRGRVYSDSDITGLWKSQEIEMFARSAYEWNFGSKKRAFALCEHAIYSMIIGELVNEHLIHDNVNNVVPYDTWKLKIIDILVSYPSLDITLSSWIEQFRCVLSQELKSINLAPRKGKEIVTIVKIKSRDTKQKDFKDKPIIIYLEKKIKEGYTRSSVHGVKGETYEALLLYVQSQKGNTLTPSFLNKGSLKKELMRIAYVAMTRPRRLLIVAMPSRVTKVEYARFSKDKWDYISLE